MHLFTLLTALLFAQNSDILIQEKFRVDYVLLDIVALDKKGNLVTDLKASDFEIRENKKQVEIGYFDTLDFRMGPQADVSDVPEEFQEQVAKESVQQIVLALDLESVWELESKKIFKNMYDFMKSLDNTQEYRINIYNMERGSVTKGFVKTKEAAIAALQELETNHIDGLSRKRGGSTGGSYLLGDGGTDRRSNRNNHNSGFGRNRTDMLNPDKDGFEDLEKAFATCRTMFSRDPSRLSECINDTLQSFALAQQDRSDRIIGELEILTYAFEDTPGMKMIMFVSPGFARDTISSAVDLANVYKGNNQQAFYDSALGSLDIRSDFRRVVHACIKNRVIFHTFDILNHAAAFNRESSVAHSVNSSGITRAYRNWNFDITSGLRDLASDTGGQFKQVPSLKKAMNTTLETNKFFYVVGYNSPAGKPGKFRKIKVKVKRKGIKLRHRTGYFGKK